MSILEMMGGANGAAVQQLSAQFGLTPEQAQAALGALLPLVTAGVQREAASKGEAGIAAAIASGGHENYLTQPSALGDPATVTDGNAILGHIFGTKDVSRQAAADAAAKTGIDPAILRKMLPIVAAIVMGALARRSKGAGTGGAPSGGAQTGGPGGLGGLAGGGLGAILGSLLDRDHDGSVLDDLGGMIGGSLGPKR
ncbi:MAG: DUF937 domain-containing protein [Longimicrobiales bacterium]